jgi:hypothetical protein
MMRTEKGIIGFESFEAAVKPVVPDSFCKNTIQVIVLEEMRRRPTFEELASVPLTPVPVRRYPATEFMNSPQVASLLANQEGLETQAEADMKRKQFDSLMTQRGLEFGLPPAAMRVAAETANQQGRGAFFMRWLRGEREVPATSGGPPLRPAGVLSVSV